MSKLCDQVVDTLRKLFPQIRIKTEHFVFFRGQKLFVDIFIPQLGLMIEVHGRQHDEFVEHFHTDIEGFRASKRRDAMKEEWAGQEGYTYIVIREDQLPVSPQSLLEILNVATNP